MKTILVVFPTSWDGRQLAACAARWQDAYTIVEAAPSDGDCPTDLDIPAYIDELVATWRGRIDGVMSSSDYPGATVAAAVATALELPGSRPDTIIRCSHKYYSRLAQRESVPEATANFELIDPNRPLSEAPQLNYPCFIKPVKGAFSVMSAKLAGPGDLATFLADPAVASFSTDYVRVFNQLVERYTDFSVNGSHFLAEAFLHGHQVTVEGYALDGRVEILGIVDSIMHPGTGSFARFDYPSLMRPEIQRRMEDIARRVIAHLGLQRSLFNIEMIYEPASDAIHIIEINPRICGQFGDLYQKVDGINSFEIALALAAGETPALTRGGGNFAMATSFPLRLFSPAVVEHAPAEQDIERVLADHPGALVWSECVTGQRLDDFKTIEDGHSARYAIVNIGGDSRADLMARRAALERDLGYCMRPL